MMGRLPALLLLVALFAASCGGDSDGAGAPSTSSEGIAVSESVSEDASQHFPDVLAVQSEQAADGSWTFTVTLSSPYDTPEQYADAWRVVGSDGTEFGFRLLTHDHANEQPFTRSQNGVVIPEGELTVTVEGRDLINGWGGASLEHDLSG